MKKNGGKMMRNLKGNKSIYKVFLSAMFILLLVVAVGCSSKDAGSTDTGNQGTVNNNTGSQASNNDTSSKDDYPDKTMTMVVPFNAGGGADAAARQFTPYLEKELGVNLVVENRAGAGTQVAMHAQLTGDQDGYTFINLHQPHASFTIYNQSAPYNIEDFEMVNFHVIDPGAMSVANDSPIQTMTDLVDLIKEKPGEIAIGTVQNSGPHVLMYWMQENLDLNFIIVPYEGGAPARTALLGGELDAYFGYAVGNYTMRDQTRTIGVSWTERHPLWPDVPTMTEELDIVVPNMASYRGIAFSKEFKENHPERFETFAQIYKKAFDNEEFQEKYKDEGLFFATPEEAQEMLLEIDKLIKEYARFFQ